MAIQSKLSGFVGLAVFAFACAAWFGSRQTDSRHLYTVSSLGLNCREDAELDSPVRAHLARNMSVEVLDLANGWAKVQSRGGYCWAMARFLTPQAPPAAAGVSWPGGERRTTTAVAMEGSAVRIPLADEGGTYTVPVEVNHAVKLNFIVDSGASEVTIPADVFQTLVGAGTITTSDLGPVQTYKLANGERVRSRRFNIRSLVVGGATVQNISGSTTNQGGALLLGQSFLNQFDGWSIDRRDHDLVLYAPSKRDP